jgi:hypothetical protein
MQTTVEKEYRGEELGRTVARQGEGTSIIIRDLAPRSTRAVDVTAIRIKNIGIAWLEGYDGSTGVRGGLVG